MRHILAALAVVGLFVLIGSGVPKAHADILNYTETATGLGGILDGTTFNNAVVTLTLIGDTSNIVTSPGSGGGSDYSLIGTSATISVAGVGNDTITDTVELLSGVDSAGVEFFDKSTNGTILSIILPTTFNPAAPFRPVTTGSGGAGGGGFFTTGGDFAFSSFSANPSLTFSATEAPEPSSLLLLAIGLLALGLLAWRHVLAA